jgi:hypothetical protein
MKRTATLFAAALSVSPAMDDANRRGVKTANWGDRSDA